MHGDGAHQDSGTLQYDIYLNDDDDESEAIIIERYRDSEAGIEHLAHVDDLMKPTMATGSVCGEVLGEPSAELRAKMDGSEVRFFTPFQSM